MTISERPAGLLGAARDCFRQDSPLFCVGVLTAGIPPTGYSLAFVRFAWREMYSKYTLLTCRVCSLHSRRVPAPLSVTSSERLLLPWTMFVVHQLITTPRSTGTLVS